VIVLRVARAIAVRTWNRWSRGRFLAAGVTDTRFGRLISGAQPRVADRAPVLRIGTEGRLYISIVQPVMLWLAGLLGPAIGAVVATFVSIFPHGKTDTYRVPRTRLSRPGVRAWLRGHYTALRDMTWERAGLVGVPFPGPAITLREGAIWKVFFTSVVVPCVLQEDDVRLSELLNPSRWGGAVWVTRITFRVMLPGTPFHIDLFVQVYGVEGRQITAMRAAPKVVGIHAVVRVFTNWMRLHDLVPPMLPGLRHLVVPQLGVGFGSLLGNWLEQRLNLVRLERRRADGSVSTTSLVTIYEGPLYALGRLVRRAASVFAPARTRASGAGAADRRSIKRLRWRIEHLRRAILRIEAEIDRQRAALQRATRARPIAALEVAIKSNERRVAAVRSVIAELLDELAGSALDRLLALRDDLAMQLGEIEERIAAGATGRRLLRRRDALAAAVAATDAQLDEVDRFVATAPERNLPHGSTPALQTPAGP
jgi:hypothetical protein